MEKALVVFDIDGTIGGLPVEPLLHLLEEFRGRGLTFGINTNRPFSEAIGIYDALRMEGPLITEDGAEVRPSKGAPAETAAEGLLALNEVVAGILSAAYGHGERARFLWCDDKTNLSSPGPGRIVLVTRARKFTTSVYARENGYASGRFTEEVMKAIFDGLGMAAAAVSLKMDASGGKIIGSNTRANRLDTLFRTVRNRYPECWTLMVSDDEPANPSAPTGLTFAAVRMASPEYRRRCRIVATLDGTEGLRQILETFLKQPTL